MKPRVRHSVSDYDVTVGFGLFGDPATPLPMIAAAPADPALIDAFVENQVDIYGILRLPPLTDNGVILGTAIHVDVKPAGPCWSVSVCSRVNVGEVAPLHVMSGRVEFDHTSSSVKAPHSQVQDWHRRVKQAGGVLFAVPTPDGNIDPRHMVWIPEQNVKVTA